MGLSALDEGLNLFVLAIWQSLKSLDLVMHIIQHLLKFNNGSVHVVLIKVLKLLENLGVDEEHLLLHLLAEFVIVFIVGLDHSG